MAAIDRRYRLVGDADLGVGLDCRDCDRGGKPVAYYPGLRPAYAGDTGVENVTTIFGLLVAADRHTRTVHGG